MTTHRVLPDHKDKGLQKHPYFIRTTIMKLMTTVSTSSCKSMMTYATLVNKNFTTD
jgi:hypothetical protein